LEVHAVSELRFSPSENAKPLAKRDAAGWCNCRSRRPWRRIRSAPRAPEGSAQPDLEASQDDSTVERIKGLPTSIGVILIAAGVAGLILPGPWGTPLIVAGGLVLAPGAFGRFDTYMKTRFPGMRHHGMKVLERFLDDMQKRYPDDPKPGS
jgi:hypothetical protein